MSKFRIVKLEDRGAVSYLVERKRWFGWRTLTVQDFNEKSSCTEWCKFNTQEEAFNAIPAYWRRKAVIVQEVYAS